MYLSCVGGGFMSQNERDILSTQKHATFDLLVYVDKL